MVVLVSFIRFLKAKIILESITTMQHSGKYTPPIANKRDQLATILATTILEL